MPEAARPNGKVLAAGGIVRRPDRRPPEIVLVHRPAYDDWTLPKGKLEKDETWEAAARREVAEETGLECRLVKKLGETSYVDRRGRDKVVSYWLMEPTADQLTPAHEVDDARWVPIGEALAQLTYDRDRQLLQASLREVG